MFLFGKKKVKSSQEVKLLSDDDRKALVKQAEEKISTLEGLDDERQILILNEIGSLYFQAELWDEAILFYEKSLAIKREMGKPYTDLMTLYNKKRQKAAEAKNDRELEFYLGKVQEMMQMSKDMLRGKM